MYAAFCFSTPYRLLIFAPRIRSFCQSFAGRLLPAHGGLHGIVQRREILCPARQPQRRKKLAAGKCGSRLCSIQLRRGRANAVFDPVFRGGSLIVAEERGGGTSRKDLRAPLRIAQPEQKLECRIDMLAFRADYAHPSGNAKQRHAPAGVIAPRCPRAA